MAPTLPAFEHVLAANPSATVALSQWCAARHIAPDPTIRATRIATDPETPPSAAIYQALGLAHGTPLAYRHVRLTCGGVILSEAHNWYVPARLSPEMNAQLATTDTPFGKVVSPLGFIRQPLSAREGVDAPCPQGTILSHRARLVLPSGAALAMVIECYTPANIAR